MKRFEVDERGILLSKIKTKIPLTTNGYSKRHWRRKIKQKYHNSCERILSRCQYFEQESNPPKPTISSITDGFSGENSYLNLPIHQGYHININNDFVYNMGSNMVSNEESILETENDLRLLRTHPHMPTEREFQEISPDDSELFNRDSEEIGHFSDVSDIFNEDFTYRYSDDEDDDEPSYITFDDLNVQENDSHESDDSISIATVSDSLKEILVCWSVTCNIPQNSLGKLLRSIRTQIPKLSLPVDPRTLLKTPRNSKIYETAGGHYCHFGVENCVEKIVRKRVFLNNENKKINLLINMDGAPLGASSEKNLWPILCSEEGEEDVYIIGVYAGQFKPTDSNEYLQKFVDDAIELSNAGYKVDNERFNVNIYALVCDAPAKAFILNIKSHSGYNSCTKCEIEGDYINCVVFPGKVAKLRTDEEFRRNVYLDNYQHKETILNNIPRLGLVTGVPIDCMHLVYLGCMRRLLLIWLKSDTPFKLRAADQTAISDNFMSLGEYIPCEFARKPKSLRFINFFKATEFRLILLYTGIVAFKDVLDDDVYLNFVTLHVIITILSSPKFCRTVSLVNYAQKLLDIFVQHYQNLYGVRYVSHNIHNLLHIVDDVKKYGSIEKYSAFKYENFIGQIKKMIRKGDQPLQQLMRRCAELEIVNNKCKTFSPNTNGIDYKATQQHNQGPLPPDVAIISQYKCVEFEKFKINCKDLKNNSVMIDNKLIVSGLNFIRCLDNELYIVGKEMNVVGDLYHFPCPSSRLGIHIVSESEKEYTAWNVKRITGKLMKLPSRSKFVVIPMIHTMSD